MYSTSTPTPASQRNLAIARVKAAGRVQAERQRAVSEPWQLLSREVDWCFICSRATDHTGEHSPEQIAAWEAERAHVIAVG